MENQYVKTYPALMKGKTVMYVHGFASAASTNTVKILQTLMPSARVIADDIPLNPTEAMTMLREMAERERPDLIIGTSMGGMYTEMLRGYDRILVNPAFEMGDTMAEHGMIGKLTYQNPRKDGVQEFIVTKAMVKEYKEMTTHCFQDMTDDDRRRVFGVFGDKDPLVHTFPLFNEHYPNALHFHGGHFLTESIVHHYIIPLIREIDDHQEGRQRPVVYFSFESMIDQHQKARSSLRKAYELLLESYDIHIVAPAPTNDHSFLSFVQDWVEDNLSLPAHDKVIFCNRPELLLGDYLISTSPNADFMGTVIELGSPSFKTWEDIIVFFDRLGGQ